MNTDANEYSARLNRFIRFDPRLLVDGRLEVIVKYNGELSEVARQSGVSFEILNESFAIATGDTRQIAELYSFPNIEYIELPKTLTFELTNSINQACISRTRTAPYELTGKGCVIGLIDSGLDYTHPDFRNEDGSTRIISIWDQSIDGNPPEGFLNGSEYTEEQINTALAGNAPYTVVPSRDFAGHGTAVAGIACGNGRSSGGREKGAAYEARIIVVKLGRTGYGAFARTTEIMRAFKYISDKAQALLLPLSINLSYGTNNGPHDGNTLFEQYIDDIASKWKTSISVASGNEGNAGHHYADTVGRGESVAVEFASSGGADKMYMTLWKNFADTFSFRLTAPNRSSSVEMRPELGLYVFTLDGVDITAYYLQPTVYSASQEIYFLFDGNGQPLPEGIWELAVTGESVVDGRFDIWLPTLEDVTGDTAFSRPSVDITLTLPSTSDSVISVGGYNGDINADAPFSGRGYTRSDIFVKPDLVAPAVNIYTTRAGGGYDRFSGTSMASPFVCGCCALMMEWGIVRGNDPFLYGQKIKAFLQKGAKRNAGDTYPNMTRGYGALCLSNTMEELVRYNGQGIGI